MATFTNQATLSYNNNVIGSNIVTGELVDVLSATKTAVQNSYTDGETITYIINIVNSGTTDYQGLTVSDNLGEYEVTGGASAFPLDYIDGTAKYFINGEPQADPTVTAGPPLIISDITVPAGGNTALIYTAAANGYAPLDVTGTIVNTATLSGAGLAADITAQNTLDAAEEPELSITKSVNPVTVTGNVPLTYTLVVSNAGNTAATAADNVVIADTFDPVLSITNVTLNGAPLTVGEDYTYNSSTGDFATAAGVITVPAAEFTQDPDTGEVTVTPGTATLTVTGTIAQG